MVTLNLQKAMGYCARSKLGETEGINRKRKLLEMQKSTIVQLNEKVGEEVEAKMESVVPNATIHSGSNPQT